MICLQVVPCSEDFSQVTIEFDGTTGNLAQPIPLGTQLLEQSRATFGGAVPRNTATNTHCQLGLLHPEHHHPVPPRAALTATPTPAHTELYEDAVVAVIQRYYDASHAHDLEGLRAAITKDCYHFSDNEFEQWEDWAESLFGETD